MVKKIRSNLAGSSMVVVLIMIIIGGAATLSIIKGVSNSSKGAGDKAVESIFQGASNAKNPGPGGPGGGNKTPIPVRYVRDWLNGSNKNAGNHWYEIEVYENGENIAYGKNVTSNVAIYRSNVFTDGNRAGTYGYTASGNPAYVELDLGKIHYSVDNVKIFHYYPDRRVYENTKTEVSPDGKNWYTIFDSAVTGTYVEVPEGRTSMNLFQSN